MFEGRRDDFGEEMLDDLGLTSSSALLHSTKRKEKKEGLEKGRKDLVMYQGHNG
jgi:hypothetical protein